MRKLTILLAAMTLMACDRSKPELEKTLAQVQQISAEKDSLLKDVMATSQFIAEVNTELAKVKTRNAGKPVKGQVGDLENNMTPSEQRASIVKKVTALTARLNESEDRLSASRKRVADLAGNNTALTAQLASYDSTIASFKTIMEGQKSEIAQLNDQLTALNGENTQLKADKVQLVSEKTAVSDERDKLTTERNTVYYVIGSKGDLLKRHIIVQTGGMLGMGKDQVPARELNAADFTSVDKTKTAEIPFPDSTKAYRIVTRQDLAALETAPDKNGRIKGGLKIKDADGFWAASKYLIIIQQ
jgi:predicted  nucleic acid-binding Zn-ribbon protein